MSAANPYQRVWSKYIPVISMKLKTAIAKNESQAMNLDRFDFENAGLRKNTSHAFNLELREGRAQNSGKLSTLAKEFALSLNENQTIKDILKAGHFNFKVDSKFVLTIQKNQPAGVSTADTPVVAAEAEVVATDAPVTVSEAGEPQVN